MSTESATFVENSSLNSNEHFDPKVPSISADTGGVQKDETTRKPDYFSPPPRYHSTVLRSPSRKSTIGA